MKRRAEDRARTRSLQPLALAIVGSVAWIALLYLLLRWWIS